MVPSIGATLLYLFMPIIFFKEMIKDKFLKKFQNLETKFKKSEFLYLLIYRFVGGTPFNLQNFYHVFLMSKFLISFGQHYRYFSTNIFNNFYWEWIRESD